MGACCHAPVGVPVHTDLESQAMAKPSQRDTARVLLTAALDGDDVLAHNLEVAIYNHVIRAAVKDCIMRYWENPVFAGRYRAMVRHIRFNITNQANPSLRNWVLNGQLPVTELVKMSPQEMFPEHWIEAILAAQELQAMRTVVRDRPQEHEGLIQCNTCKSKRVMHYEMQTRSADEPMTVFCACTNCGRRWRM